MTSNVYIRDPGTQKSDEFLTRNITVILALFYVTVKIKNFMKQFVILYLFVYLISISYKLGMPKKKKKNLQCIV